TTLQVLTDNFRNIVTDPYDGLHESSRIEVYPLIEQMQSVFLGQKEWMGMLPRKCNTAISATPQSGFHFFGNDIFFALAQGEGQWGFNLFLGGKNSEASQDADIFVPPQRVVVMFEAVSRAFMKYGLRGSRAKTRLFHLLSEIGMERFREKIAEFYPHETERGGVLRLQKAPKQQFAKLRDGRYGYCHRSRFGRITHRELEQLVAYARQNALEIRLGVDQNIYLLGLQKPQVPFDEPTGAAHITACAGSRYCALSLWNIKEETAFLPLARLEKEQITVGFSGCLKGCGRHHHEDIGLVGLRTNLFGPVTKAARLFLGTEYGTTQKAARLIFHVVPLEQLSDLIEVIIDEYKASGEEDFESFSKNHLNRYSTGFLMLWFLAKLYLRQNITFEGKEEQQLYRELLQQPDFPRHQESNEYETAVRVMMHEMWDTEA
ncbi:MAG: nitrite/sulfite reductase, partial [Sulfurospirillum sp.]